MTQLTDPSATHALDRLADWQTALRAENKSPGTVAGYTDGATRYPRWCAAHDHLPMSRASLNQWVADMLDAGAAPGTAHIRQQAVRRFASWLTAGGEIHTDLVPGVKAPRVEPPIVEPLTDDELRASSRPAPCPTRGRPLVHPPIRPCTTAATRPSSGSCSRQPSGPGKSSSCNSTTST
jgi:hypothetical protein